MMNFLRSLTKKEERDPRPRILVVEDEAIVAHDLQRRLTRLGYGVAAVACAGLEAVDRALELQPELILMDINLGEGMNGIEAALTIRQQQDLPVVYITANSDADTARQAARSGPFGYILKPFEDRELEAAIQLGLVKHEMEHRLKESQRWFNAMLTSIAEGVLATGPDGCIAFFNPAAEKITGRLKADVLGRKLTDVFPLGNDGTHQAHTDFFSAFEQATLLPVECRTALLIRQDGARIPIEYRAAHIHDARGQSRCAIISFSDITARNLAEENARLAQQELNAAHRRLQHKHQELQGFYHTVSHELKTPLTSAREFVSLMLEGIAGPVNDTQNEYLALARESCDQMCTCINDMLDVTRLQTGKLSLELKRASAGDLALRVVAGLRPEAERKGIRLTCSVKPGAGQALIDETRIAQVIGNLLNNALKFTSTGGRVSVLVQPIPNNNRHLQIVVADTGRGIPTEHLERIFDRLYQVHSSDNGDSMGLGLGLHICHELVRLHNGSIRVESAVGRGSTFYITLPVCPGDGPRLSPPENSPGLSCAHPKHSSPECDPDTHSSAVFTQTT